MSSAADFSRSPGRIVGVSHLQAELESLRQENARLRKLLKLTDAEAAPAHGTQAAWFDKAPGPVDGRSSSRAKVEFLWLS